MRDQETDLPDFWRLFMEKFLIEENLRRAERRSTALLDARLAAIKGETPQTLPAPILAPDRVLPCFQRNVARIEPTTRYAAISRPSSSRIAS